MPVMKAAEFTAPSEEMDSTPNLKVLFERRRTEIRYFLDAITSISVRDDAKDPEFFRALVTLAVMEYRVNRQALAGLLRADVSAISRWMNGHNLPKPYARGEVIAKIAELLELMLADDSYLVLDEPAGSNAVESPREIVEA